MRPAREHTQRVLGRARGRKPRVFAVAFTIAAAAADVCRAQVPREDAKA
jgi:hypothetical protein